MVLLKRKSCPGCEACGWESEQLYEIVCDEHLPIIESMEDQALYKLIFGTDWKEIMRIHNKKGLFD